MTKKDTDRFWGRYPSTREEENDDPRLIQALHEYQALLAIGRKPNRTEFLRHRDPEVAESLAECLDGLEFVRGEP